MLPPGVVGHITLYFQASTTAPVNSPISFALGVSADSQPIDWSSIEAEYRPSYIASDAWDAIWGNFWAGSAHSGPAQRGPGPRRELPQPAGRNE